MASQRNSSPTNDKDAVLLSIHGKLDEIVDAFEEIADQSANIIEVRDLKDYSAELLKHIFKEKRGDSRYIIVPKTSAELFDDRGAMMTRVDEDVVNVRGYLRGKPKETHVADFCSLRNRVDLVLKAANKAAADEKKPKPVTPNAYQMMPFNMEEVQARVRRITKTEHAKVQVGNLFTNFQPFVPDAASAASKSSPAKTAPSPRVIQGSRSKQVPGRGKGLARLMTQKSNIERRERQVWIFKTAENPTLAPKDVRGGQAQSHIFVEHTLIQQSAILNGLLSKKRTSRGSWDRKHAIVFDPAIQDAQKEFKGERFYQKIIYLDAYIQSRAKSGNMVALAVASMSLEQQWAAACVWYNWVEGRGIQMARKFSAQQCALRMGELLGAKGDYMRALREHSVEKQ